MVTGKVLNFDEFRGYGFISSSAADEDVFMHANDLLDDKSMIRSGAVVEFEMESGDRGLKASNVRVVERAPAQEVHRPARTQAPAQSEMGDDTLCDVLSARELRDELTEGLLEKVPAMSAAQILAVRKCVLDIARTHNWVER